MDQSAARLLEKMTRIRDLAATIADLLNPSMPADVRLGYSRAFVHASEGFGIYARFRRAGEWEDLEHRLCRFFDAVESRNKDWSRFLTWRKSKEKSGDFTPGWLSGEGLNQMVIEYLRSAPGGSAAAYEQLLALMLSTPASWGDGNYLRIHKQAGVPFEPFLAEFRRDAVDDPWSLTTWRSGSHGIEPFGSANVSHGELSPDAPEGSASIYWEMLYPLCNRVDFDPPQDPTKGKRGVMVQLILPVLTAGVQTPLAWILCQVESNVGVESMNGLLKVSANSEVWNGLQNKFIGILSDS